MTTLEIWNAALALLPHDRTVAAEDEDSTEALRCRQHWDAARRYVLGARDWNWLAREEPGCCGAFGGWSRPAGALRIVGLVDPSGRRLRCRASDGMLFPVGPDAGRAVAVRYVPDCEDPALWPPSVAEAVAAELAARLAPVLTDNAQRESALMALAARRLEDAGESDANETAGDGGDPLAFARARR